MSEQYAQHVGIKPGTHIDYPDGVPADEVVEAVEVDEDVTEPETENEEPATEDETSEEEQLSFDEE